MFKNYRIVNAWDLPKHLQKDLHELIGDGGDYIEICSCEFNKTSLPSLIIEAQRVYGWLLDNGAVPNENILIRIK